MWNWTDDSALWSYRHGNELTDERTWSAWQYLKARLDGNARDAANEIANGA